MISECCSTTGDLNLRDEQKCQTEPLSSAVAQAAALLLGEEELAELLVCHLEPETATEMG